MQIQEIKAVIQQYEKHGWNLRRVLLSPKLENLKKEFGKVEVQLTEIDALWFSRPSADNHEAWELRRLSQTPYALFEILPTAENEEVRRKTWQKMEEKLKIVSKIS